MIRRMVVMLLACTLVFGGFFGFQAFKAKIIKQVMASFANPPQTVSTTTAAYQEWQPQLKAVGSLRAVNGAALSFELAGIVDSIEFESGDDVPAGKVLLRLHTEDDIARLHALQATADLDQIIYDRDYKQLKAQAVSQATLDADLANLKNARAQVVAQQATVDKKILRAPFAGHLGIRAVDVGQYLNPGTTVVTLEQLDPIYVDFSLPQQALDRLKPGQPVSVTVDTYGQTPFAGKIRAIDPAVDTNSRNAQLRAELRNPDHKLLPGMFATLDIDVGQRERHITLPQTAITYNPYGSTAFLVQKNGAALTARQAFVTTGATRGDQVAVLSGVNEGDVVVTAGQIKLRNGSLLAINNKVQPADSAAPPPTDH